MGQKSRQKQHRRRAHTARFTVLSPGMLEVLSVGKGDLKIQIGDSNDDRANAQRIIEEMIRKGYTLFVETADGPLKVTKFLPDKMAYLVADTPGVVPEPEEAPDEPADEMPEDEAVPAPDKPAAKPVSKPGRRRKVPVAGSRTTAIGRTAGG